MSESCGTDQPSCLELCAGAGGQALGLEMAGFRHEALVEIDPDACKTLRLNRPEWNVIEGDLRVFDAAPYEGVDLVAGGVPCPPFSRAGLRLGEDDERDMFPFALSIVEVVRPRAVMLENVKGLLSPAFAGYRQRIDQRFRDLGYEPMWKLLYASDFGVPQLRPRVVCVALLPKYVPYFIWPSTSLDTARTVGEALYTEMASHGWAGAMAWALKANRVAPTIVGGSKRHGGPDLGPTQARLAWKELGVEGGTIAAEPPGPDFEGLPRLTVRMTATIQGFPSDWELFGKKTTAYRQVGNAFPPPVAAAVARQIRIALTGSVGSGAIHQPRMALLEESLPYVVS